MSAERIAILRDRIRDYEQAIHDIAMGRATVKLSYEGNSSEFSRANLAELKQLKQEAQIELNQLLGIRRGPFRMVTG